MAELTGVVKQSQSLRRMQCGCRSRAPVRIILYAALLFAVLHTAALGSAGSHGTAGSSSSGSGSGSSSSSSGSSGVSDMPTEERSALLKYIHAQEAQDSAADLEQFVSRTASTASSSSAPALSQAASSRLAGTTSRESTSSSSAAITDGMSFDAADYADIDALLGISREEYFGSDVDGAPAVSGRAQRSVQWLDGEDDISTSVSSGSSSSTASRAQPPHPSGRYVVLAIVDPGQLHSSLSAAAENRVQDTASPAAMRSTAFRSTVSVQSAASSRPSTQAVLSQALKTLITPAQTSSSDSSSSASPSAGRSPPSASPLRANADRVADVPSSTVEAEEEEEDWTPELHFIDHHHALFFLPVHARASLTAASAQLGIRVLDVFGNASGAQLKVSESLRPLTESASSCRRLATRLESGARSLLQRCVDVIPGRDRADRSSSSNSNSESSDDAELESSSSSGASRSSQGGGSGPAEVATLLINLYTAVNEAEVLASDLAVSPRLAAVAQYVEALRTQSGQAGRTTRLEHSASSSSAEGCDARFTVVDSRIVQMELRFAATCGEIFTANNSLATCVCMEMVLEVASHHAVRWIEPAALSASLQNFVATATLQGWRATSPLALTAQKTLNGTATDSNASSIDSPSSASSNSSQRLSSTQGALGASDALWVMGINGSGEIVSIADSGVDVSSCYFEDPSQPVALYPSVNPRHRKIVSYYSCLSSGKEPVSYASPFASPAAFTAADDRLWPTGSSTASAFTTTLSGQSSVWDAAAYAGEQTFFTATDAGDKERGHGTHVAGTAVGCALETTDTHAGDSTAAALGGKPDTPSAYNGVAPGAKLFVRALGCGGSDAAGATTGATAPSQNGDLPLPSDMSEVFSTAYAAGARISSNSWGFESEQSYSAVERMVDDAAHRYDDMLLLFAVGNNPSVGVFAPGTAKNVMAIGAHVNSFDEAQRDIIPSFSAYGPTYDKRRKPELLGPGGGAVWSAYASGRANESQCGITKKVGTSMATAAVAGAAALTRQFLREHIGVAAPSSALLRAMLMHGTARLPLVDGAPSPKAGFGRLDLALILGSVARRAGSGGDSSTSTVIETVDGGSAVWVQDRLVITDREMHSFCFSARPSGQSVTSDAAVTSNTTARAESVTDPRVSQGVPSAANASSEGRALKVTIAWTDPADALEGSRRSLINDLDLVVVDADGKMYYTDLADPETVFFDRENNAEQVRIPLVTSSLARVFRVFVYGSDVRHSADGQPYSLVVSAPGLQVSSSCEEALASPAVAGGGEVRCPGNCSGTNGACDSSTKQCTCASGFRFADCSLCDEVSQCNRHGTCSVPSMACECDANSHFVDAKCSVCASGWYGPLCNSQCTCRNKGSCDTTTGLCVCPTDRVFGGLGCFQGTQCQYCCEGYGGPGCNERSYWCNETPGAVVQVDDGDGGYIQVNGYDSYPYSVTCRWNVTALPYHIAQLEYLRYDIEKPYDSLYLFDCARRQGSSSSGTRAAASSQNGMAACLVRHDNGVLDESNAFTVDSAGRLFLLVFQSDWAQVRAGFLIRYTFVPVSRCKLRCSSSSGSAASSALTCGEAIGLLNWCLCSRPYVGWGCGLVGLGTADSTSSAQNSVSMAAVLSTVQRLQQGTGKVTASSLATASSISGKMSLVNPPEALRPINSYFVSEATLPLRELATNPAAGEENITVEALARMPVVVNGYTLLRVQSLYNDSSSSRAPASPEAANASTSAGDREWIATLTLIPFASSSTWITEVTGLKLGISLVYKLRSELLSSNLSQMQTIDMHACPENPLPTFKVPLRIPTTSLSQGGSKSIKLEALLLLTLLWNATQEAPLAAQKNIYLDAAIYASQLEYTHPLRAESPRQQVGLKGSCSASSSAASACGLAASAIDAQERQDNAYGLFLPVDLGLQCNSSQSGFVVGAATRVAQPQAQLETYKVVPVLTVWQLCLCFVAFALAGVIAGIVSLRKWQFMAYAALSAGDRAARGGRAPRFSMHRGLLAAASTTTSHSSGISEDDIDLLVKASSRPSFRGRVAAKAEVDSYRMTPTALTVPFGTPDDDASTVSVLPYGADDDGPRSLVFPAGVQARAAREGDGSEDMSPGGGDAVVRLTASRAALWDTGRDVAFERGVVNQRQKSRAKQV